MPTHQMHRGAHPKDIELFSGANIKILYQAARDLSELLTKGYPENGSLKLVGDHFRLKSRQRKAVMRIAIPDQIVKSIKSKEIFEADVMGKALSIDGFNMLIFAESLLGRGFLFKGMDNVFRDIASIHGTYKKVLETGRAIQLLGKAFHDLKACRITWYLDAPVSNSGRLKTFLEHQSGAFDESWKVKVVYNPDEQLKDVKNEIVCTNDRIVLEGTSQWFNLSEYLVEHVDHRNPNVIFGG